MLQQRIAENLCVQISNIFNNVNMRTLLQDSFRKMMKKKKKYDYVFCKGTKTDLKTSYYPVMLP